MQWIVDGTVHLTEICQVARWHWRTCVAGLESAGLSHDDACTYAGWAFGTDAVYQRAVGDETLTPEEYARLRVAASDPPMHPVAPGL